ncbi:MAG: DUF2142 domain-containing protein, partial [Acidimicrobiales bacterium]
MGRLRGRDVSARQALVVSFVLLFLLMAVWTIATPLVSAPDEQAHISKAAAVVRGELIGHLRGGPLSPRGIVTVPRAYGNLGPLVICYQFKSYVPASCAPPYEGGGKLVRTEIYTARYQPLYYAIVGLPSLLTDSKLGIYLMRLLSAALSALAIALAVFAVVAWSESRWPLAGILVATTPSVLSLGAVVNPSGLEIALGICLWTAGAVLVFERLRDPPAGLVALVAVAGGIECLVRSISPLLVLLTAISLLFLADFGQLSSAVRHISVKLGAAFTAACGAVGAAWVLTEHSLNITPGSAPLGPKPGEFHILGLALAAQSLQYTE